MNLPLKVKASPRMALAAMLALIASPWPALGQQSPTTPPALMAHREASVVKVAPEAPKENLSTKQPNGSLLARKHVTYTSPNYKPPVQPKLENNIAHGSEGVMEGQRVVMPFGSKGEHVAIQFHNGTFVPPAGERIQPAMLMAAERLSAADGGIAGGAVQPSQYGMILLNGWFDDGTRAVLASKGVEVLGTYPDSAILARIPIASLNAISQLPTVRWIGQPTAAQKIHRDVAKKILASPNSAQPLHVWVSFYTQDRAGNMRADLKSIGVGMGHYDQAIAVQETYATPAQIQKLVALDHVLFVEPVNSMHTMNEIGPQAMNADWLWGGYDPAAPATQVKIGLLDTGMYVYHNDFSNVFGGLIGYDLVSGEHWYNDLNGHGSHVSGTILGEGNADYRYRGIADRTVSHGDPNNNPDYLVAQVLDQNGNGSFSTFVTGADLLDSGSGVPGFKRQVWNASLGGSTGGTENTAECRKVDSCFGDNILCCIAAGNSGPNSSTIGLPGAAKGALTVGSVYDNTEAGVNPDQITGYSSRGPTGGGKFKPDIVATGSYIDSVKTGTASSYALDWEGTSMATPHITGIAAGLIGQYGYPAWVAKAAILASAIDLGYGRNTQGLGKVDAMQAHYTLDGGMNWWWNSIGGTGSLQYMDLTLGHAVAQLKIVMTYPDPPCAAGATNVMVNDLDLYVQSSNYGALTTDGTRQWSDVSTEPVSVVTLTNVPAGTYRIKVYAFSNAGGNQPWAVAAKVVDSALYPSLHTSMSLPYAVKPGVGFYASTSVYPDAHSATSIAGSIGLSSGLQIDGVRRWRNSATGSESIFMWSPGGPAYYEMNHFNLGSAPAYYTRYNDWYLEGTTEGVKTVSFNASSANSFAGGSSGNVIIDGTSATISLAEGRNWTQSLHCDVVCPVQDTLSGINPATGWYHYSTDGGSTWSAWLNPGTSGSYGSTAVQTITATDVPFNQNNTNNVIEFYVEDTAGNYKYSGNMVITTPTMSKLTLTPTTVPGGNNVTGKVLLTGNAPTGGANVALTNTNTKATCPASVTVPGGTNTATFTITTVGVTSTFSGTVTASYGGVTKSTTLKVRPVGVLKVVMSPNKVTGGAQNSTGTVTLDATAPVNTTVTLTSDNAAASVPASITIAAGGTTGTFTATTSYVSASTAAHIKAKANGIAKSATLTVNPVTVYKLTLTPTSVTAPATSTGKVVLTFPAPPGGLTVNLGTSNSAVAAPAVASITIPAGSSSGTFTINTTHPSTSPTTVAITAAATGTTKTANIKVY